METRRDFRIDVSGALPEGAGRGEPVEIAGTLVADPAAVAAAGRQVVVVAIPGASYHRRYWDMQPPGRSGYSMAAWLAARGVVFVACDYLGGGDSTRPADGDFMTLAACAGAAHAAHRQVRAAAEQGTLAPWLPPLADPVYVGVGQSLGGLILLAEQGRYADYSAIGIFGSSPLEIVLPGHERVGADLDQRRAAMAMIAGINGLDALPQYLTADRGQVAKIFYAPDMPDDLLAYDRQQCQTLVSRATTVDALVPGVCAQEAARITAPVFLAFGETADVAADPRAEPSGYPRSRDITVTSYEDMAHMHNFARTRGMLWRRFHDWTAAVTAGPRL